jgi:Zn-dependent protease/CBS domain-containing protein
VAIRYGIPVKSITLFILGGVAHILREATHPKAELLMAIAGPLCSIILSGIFAIIWFFTSRNFLGEDPINPLLWLFLINLGLALFNLLPGFPLDGGRVFRALLWAVTKNHRRSTQIAALTGQTIAGLFIVFGIILMFTNLVNPPAYFEESSMRLNGLWLAFIGWFLYNAAVTSYRQIDIRQALERFTAQAVMTSNYLTVPLDISLSDLIHSYPLVGNQYLIAVSQDEPKGIIVISKMNKVPRNRWETTKLSEIMTPLDKAISLLPEEKALSILEKMEQYNANQLPVVKNGMIIGIVGRENLLHLSSLSKA